MKLKLIYIFVILCLVGLTVFGHTKYDFVVAKDGSGQFTTVQAAFDAVPDFRKQETTIFIKKGVYKEKLNLSTSKKNVHIIGEDLKNTVLTFDDWAQRLNQFGEAKGTSGSASCYIYGEGFTAEHVTFENSAGPVGQAVALFVAGDKATFIDCRMLGFQDTLYTYGYGSRQFYFKCYIEGTVDFIFGSSTAVFERCAVFCKKSGYITAPSTPDTVKYGFVFKDCNITGNAPKASFYLGRPWRPYGKSVYVNCSLAAVINKAGWDNWGKASNEQTAYFAEYESKGIGGDKSGRVAWAHQLTKDQLKNYELETIFNGWKPNY